MRVRLVRRPGQHGTKAYVAQYGERLVCVRYRYDEATQKRYKTIEIIVDEQPWVPKAQAEQPPKIAPETLVGVRVAFNESKIRTGLRSVRARWNPRLQVWEVRYDKVIALSLTDRIIGTIEALALSARR
jgi:hypothetical protein